MTRHTTILILGGTAEARALADRLHGDGCAVITSLAGRTQSPLVPKGEVRIGGFGGAEGLADFLRQADIARVVDATHPFAATMSDNAVRACGIVGIPLVRLVRPAWTPRQGVDWVSVDTATAAAAALPSGARVLLTTGHAGLEAYLAREDCRFVVRVIEAPESALPTHARLLISRPPYDLAGETRLMAHEAITHLVAKNSGGAQTQAKLDAAAALGVTVVMLARPHYALAPEVNSVDEALRVLSAP